MIRIDFNRLRFLVIDDNAHMRRILRTLLHGFGTREVYEAEDGAAGLEAFTHYSPDIVITDWAMPIFDGLELTQMIRQPGANTNPYVPIIMLTGHSEKKRVIAARDAGVTEFLAKPISAKGALSAHPQRGRQSAPVHQTKSYFGPDRRRNVNPNYVGPERRKGGKADVIRQQPLLDKAKTAGMSEADETMSDKKTKLAAVVDLRRPRGDHAAEQAAQGGAEGRARRQGRLRSGGARRSRRWPNCRTNFAAGWSRNATGSTRARNGVDGERHQRGHARRAVSRRPRHQGRGGDLRLSAGRAGRRQPVPADRAHARHDAHSAAAGRPARRCGARDHPRTRPRRRRANSPPR